MSRNLLNRTLLTEWLMQTQSSQTLLVTGIDDAVAVCDQMRKLLENGYQAIYLRVESDRLASLCATLSYLTDAGIDTALGMLYPMITNIQAIYPNELSPTERPLIEVTVRPIE